MTIAEIIEKVLAGKASELTPKDVEGIKADDLVSKAESQAEADRKAAAARKEAVAEAEAVKSKLAEAENRAAQLEANADTSKSDAEKQVEALTAKLDGLTKTLEQEKQTAAAATRASKIQSIVGSQNWNRDVADDDYARHLIERRLADLDTAALDDAVTVKPIIESLQREKPALFRASAPSGNGDRSSSVSSAADAEAASGAALIETALTGSIEDAQAAIVAAGKTK